MKELEPIARWTDGQDIYRIETFADTRCYVMNGWDGEMWTDCLEVSPDDLHKIIRHDIVLCPVYRFEAENIDLSKVEEGSDAWDRAHELVDLNLRVKEWPITHSYYFTFTIPSIDEDEIRDKSFRCPDEERAIQSLYAYACHLMGHKRGDIEPKDVEILSMSVSGTYDAKGACIDFERVILADDYPIM